MALDIQFAYPQQVIKLTSVELLQSSETPMLRILGQDFSAVDSVLIDDITSPQVVVRSTTELLAEIPTELRGRTTMEVIVVSYRASYSASSLVGFRLGPTNRKVQGMGRLVQLFLKVLFTTPGTDVFNPTVGGGALKNIGKTFSRAAANGLVGDFVIAVDTTTKQITAMQARKVRLPREERLLSAQVRSARFDVSQTALVVSVLLTSQAGSVASANIVL